MDGYDNHTIAKPTYFKTNEVTAVFQLIVDTYGVPTYLEANPAMISVVTFPFLFGMMFGDMGHGSILLATALVLVFGNERLKDTLLAGALYYRYLFLFMGICATYCGFIYNEFFAMQTNIFTSCYDMSKRTNLTPTLVDEEKGEPDDLKLAAGGTWVYSRRNYKCNYPMGADPVWGISSNRLTFVNGVKMKLSVIFGVLHMTMGILHKGANCVYFKNWASLLTEVVAGLIILLGMFGWMDLLVIAKWFSPIDIDSDVMQPGAFKQIETDSTDPNENVVPVKKGDYDNQHAPSVINIMIDIVFNGGSSKTPTYTPYVGKDMQ